jgi:azurin
MQAMKCTVVIGMLTFGSTGALAASGDTESAASRVECDRLISVLEQRSPAEAHAALQQMRVYRDGNQYLACIQAAQSGESSAVGHNIQVGRILDMDVFNRDGVQIGEVDRVARGDDQKVYIFTTFRGPRWPGNKQVALPAERVALQDQKLLISGIGEDELHAMPSVHQDGRRYSDLNKDAVANIGMVSPTATGSSGQPR